MKSGKYKYFAGGLIAGKSGELLKFILKTPGVKKNFKKIDDIVKEKYINISGSLGKIAPKGLQKLDKQRGKATLIMKKIKEVNANLMNETTKAKVKVFGKGAQKGTAERMFIARSANLYRNLNRYKKSLNEKGSALLERYKNKYKNN